MATPVSETTGCKSKAVTTEECTSRRKITFVNVYISNIKEHKIYIKY